MKTRGVHQGGLTVETSEETSENGHLTNELKERLSKEISGSEVLEKGKCCSIVERNKLEVLCPMHVVPQRV